MSQQSQVKEQINNTPAQTEVALKPQTPPESVSGVVEKKQPLIAPEREVEASELARLRDILYGQQARSSDRKFEEFEGRLSQTRQELTTIFTEKMEALSDTFEAKLNTLRKDITARLEQQAGDQKSQLQTTQNSLTGRIEEQRTEQSAQLRTAQRELTEQLDEQAKEFLGQIRTTQKEFSDRLDEMNADYKTRLRAAQAEARQQDEQLRQELIQMAGTLDGRKTSRHDLGRMLLELSQRLMSEDEASSRLG